MKKIDNDFNELAYEFKTPEGLNVTIIHKKGFKRSVAAYGTSFGSKNLVQSYNGETVEHKKGLAHFLEHKLFEDENGDILGQFSKMGASANAFTSFDQTVYYFSTNLSLYEPLKLLVNFVNRFKISEPSVEKEKGIIIEELKMYDKMPDMKLLMETYANVYHHFPMKYDIGGTEASVSSTTLKDLELAYQLNYTPNRMRLVIISGEAPEKIKETMDGLTTNPSIDHVVDVFKPEPLTVVNSKSEVKFPVKTNKMSLSFKFEYHGTDLLFDEFVIRLILALNFTEFNDAYQDWLDEEIINDYFSYDVDLRDGFGVVYFFNEGVHDKKFKHAIIEIINLLKLDEDSYNQIKKRYFGQTIMSLSQYDRYAINVLTAAFKGTNYFDYLEHIRDVTFEEVLEIKKLLTNFETSFTKLY